MRTMPNDIHEMHEKYAFHTSIEKMDSKTLGKLLEFRLNFLQEELDEAKEAAETLYNPAKSSEDALMAADGVVDAMIDLIVVALGTLDAYNVDAQLAWDRVLTANLQKEVGIKLSRPNPLGLPDLIKPEGWEAPTHLDNVGMLPLI